MSRALRPDKSFYRLAEIMIRQTVFGFEIKRTEEELTAHRGLVLPAEYNLGMGLRELSGNIVGSPMMFAVLDRLHSRTSFAVDRLF
jgi:hypothetical protein